MNAVTTPYALPHGGVRQQFDHTILVKDGSGSMEAASFVPNMTKLEMMCDASGVCLDGIRRFLPDSLIGVVAYSDNGHVCCPLTPIRNEAVIQQALRHVLTLPHGGTCMAAALEIAAQWLLAPISIPSLDVRRNQFARSRIIAYSDGCDQSQQQGIKLADMLKERGVQIDCLGLGKDRSEVDENFLRRVCTTDSDGVHYRFLSSAEGVYGDLEAMGEGYLVID